MAQQCFSKQYTLEQRCQMSKQLLDRHPGMIPLIIQRDSSAETLPSIKKQKYFVSGDLPLMQLKIMIQRSSQSFKVNEGLFLFFGNSKSKRLENLDARMRDVYEKYKEQDGFLYVTYSNISMF